MCPYGKEVNTSPSHGEVCGSIPHMGTRKNCCPVGQLFLLIKKVSLGGHNFFISNKWQAFV